MTQINQMRHFATLPALTGAPGGPDGPAGPCVIRNTLNLQYVANHALII